MRDKKIYPKISDYAFLSDCKSSALISGEQSVDWCCMPRFDADPCFGRILDWSDGGFFAVSCDLVEAKSRRGYVDETMVLETVLTCDTGEVRILDFLSMKHEHKNSSRLIRMLEGVRGEMTLYAKLMMRLDFGRIKPWLRAIGPNLFVGAGANQACLIESDLSLSLFEEHDLICNFLVRANETHGFAVTFFDPVEAEKLHQRPRNSIDFHSEKEETISFWRNWSVNFVNPVDSEINQKTLKRIKRSALTLKSLIYERTGALVAAPTTSLQEGPEGFRTWDYRYSWIRDSVFTVNALSDFGYIDAAEHFKNFVMRVTANSGHSLQTLYGIEGETRLTETTLHSIDGYRNSGSVVIGNQAYCQFQADVYGELMSLLWNWHHRGVDPDKEYWRFLRNIVEQAIEKSGLPDCGIWEVRSTPRHFVQSKIMIWSAIDRGIKLAKICGEVVPFEDWQKQCDRLRIEIEEKGISRKGYFRQHYDADHVDAALLLIPRSGFISYNDPLMRRTVDEIIDKLCADGLCYRYRMRDLPDGINRQERCFVAATFWLIECLAMQGRQELAERFMERILETVNEFGLYAEEIDPKTKKYYGNYPQALSHLAHLNAELALLKMSSKAAELRKAHEALE